MPYNVQLPDGRVVEGIPDDVSHDDARKQILQSFPDVAAKEKRGWGEAVTDIGASLTRGVGQLAQLPGQIGELAGVVSPKSEDTGLQGIGKRLEQFGQESKSATLKGKEYVRDQKIAAAEGILPEFGTAIKETIKDPALLTSFFAEQLPNLVGSWGGGMIARGTTKALMSDAVKTALGSEGVIKHIGEAGIKGAVATNAVMQGADIGSDTYHTVYDQLKKQNPNMGDDELNGIALAKGRMAAIEAAGISFAATKLPGGTTIEKMLAGKGATGVGAKGILKGLAEEAASEALEEGGGKFASNVNVKEALPETSLTKGVGSAAGLGALGGGIFGGIAGHVNDTTDPAAHEAHAKAIETNTPQPVTLALPHDPSVQTPTTYGQQTMFVHPDGSMSFPSEANKFQNQNAPEAPTGELQQQFAPQPVAPTTKPITETDIRNMNIGHTNKTIREALIGKDLTNPAQAAEVKTTLESYLDQGRSPRITNAVTDFLARPEFLPAAQVTPVVNAPAVTIPEPKKRMKKLKPTAEERAAEEAPTPDEQASLQAELDAELGQSTQAPLENKDVRETTTPIGGPSESSVSLPSNGPNAPAGVGPTERRGMVPVGNVIGQPIGGETQVASALEEAPTQPLLLEPANKDLHTRHIREYKNAAANYLEKSNYIGQRALENLAGDLYTGENLKDAKRFHRGLSESQKGFVQKKLDELNKWERRGTSYSDALDKRQEAAKALREEFDGEENPKVKMTTAIESGVSSETLTTAVRNGNLNAALTEIAKGTSADFNILEKLVSNRLLANKGSLPKIEIVPAGTIQDGAAQYNPFTDTVQINEGEVDSHTVLHETTHGFLHALIQKFELEGAKNKGIADLKALYEFVKEKHPELSDRYGMESLTEFASELMSNRDFQEELAMIPYRVEHQSLFTAFIRAVLNALGLSPTQKLSALASGLIAADRTLALGRKIQEDVITGKETMPIVKNAVLGNDLGLVDKTTAGFTPLRLDTILDEYGYVMRPNESALGKGYIGYVSPDDFLKATTISPDDLARIEKESKTLDQEKLANAYPGIRLDLDKDFKLLGHEGRHRMVALRNAGIKKVPVIFSFSQGEERTDVSRVYIPPQKFYSDMFGQAGFYASNLVPINYDNKDRLAKEFGAKEGQVAFVKRDDLAANYKATGAEQRAKPTEQTGPFQTIKDTVKDSKSFKEGVSRFLNTAETMFFSADAAINNAIRKELESGGKSWETIKQLMFENSTAQATHADAVAMQFLQHGGLEYDPSAYKWKAETDKGNSWSDMVHQLADIAKKNGLTTEEITAYAQQAFIAERLKGLSQSDKQIYSHMTPAQIEAGIDFFKMIPELRDVQKTWNKVRKNAMSVAVKGGLYNEKEAKKLLDIMDYVPFYRIEQLAQNAGPKEYGRGLIDFAKNYKIEGSEQEVANIFDNMERWTSYTISRAVKNRTALNLKNTAQALFPDEVRDLRQDERVKREQNTIDIWEDGIKHKVEFKDPLFVHAFNGIESAAIPHFGIMSSVANILRKNIVLMPLFSISQLSQDSFGAMLTSGLKHPWLLPLEVAKEFTKTLMGRSAAATELSKYGATGVRDYSATFVRDSAEILAGLKKDTKSGAFKRALENFAMASDNAVRQAIYNMTMKETNGDKATAVERAFEIINFKRAGASGKIQMLRQVVPFFGAYLQAQNVIYKTLSGKGIAPQQRAEALKTLASNTLKIGALAFMYAALSADDDEYQKMDPQIRDHHLLIPGTAFMLPLRQDLTLLPKLVAEYTYLGMTDNSFTDGKKIRRAMSNSLSNMVMSPTAVPQAFKPILEVATNHDFFTGRSIIGQGIAGKVTEEQYTATTSELAKFIGSSGLIAPVNVDHLVKGYLGTTGGLGLQMTNAIVNGSNGIPTPEKSWQDAIASTPGLSAFVAKEYGNADKNDYYELRDEVAKANNTFNAMKKDGRYEDAKEFLAENMDLIKVKTQVNNINNQLTKLREHEKQIYAAPETRMSAEQKGDEVKRIRETEKRLLSNVHKLRQIAGY